MEFEKVFSSTGKVMDFKKKGDVMEKSWNFIFLVQIFRTCLKTRNILLFIEQKYAPKRLGHGKFKLVLKKSLNSIAQCLCKPCIY